MSTDRPKRESISVEEAIVSNMWEIAAIVGVLERKGLCTKHDLYDIITELRPSDRDVPALSSRACGPFPKEKVVGEHKGLPAATPLPPHELPSHTVTLARPISVVVPSR